MSRAEKWISSPDMNPVSYEPVVRFQVFLIFEETVI